MSGLFPAYILREVTNDGKPLSGGLIYSFQSGTMTPKPLYADAGLTTALSNPVELDTSGSAVMFMADGAYRIWVKDSLGIPVQPFLDGIVASGSGGAAPGTNATFALVKLYADLRALAAFPDAVYVSGRLAEGDGGQGWFQLIPGSSATDDGGVVLTAASGSKVYRRVFDAAIDPQWFGVAYGVSSNQYTTLRTALSASAAQNAPVQVAGSVYLTQSITVNAGESIRFTEDGFLASGVATQAIFAAGSYLEAEGRTFGAGVSPIIASDACAQIPLSWMGGVTGDDRIAKLAGASTKGVALIDSDATTGSSVTFPAGVVVEPAGGVITITGACILAIPVVAQAYRSAWIATPDPSASTGIRVGSISGCRLAWFSGPGAHVACLASGFVRISSGDLVTISSNLFIPDLTVVSDGCGPSDGIKISTGATLSVASWAFRGVSISGSGPWGSVSGRLTNFSGGSDKFVTFGPGAFVLIDTAKAAPVREAWRVDYGVFPGQTPSILDKCASPQTKIECGPISAGQTNVWLGPPSDASTATATRRVVHLLCSGTPSDPSYIAMRVGINSPIAQLSDGMAYQIDSILHIPPGKSAVLHVSGYKGGSLPSAQDFPPAGAGNYLGGSNGVSISIRCTIIRDDSIDPVNLLGFWSQE